MQFYKARASVQPVLAAGEGFCNDSSPLTGGRVAFEAGQAE